MSQDHEIFIRPGQPVEQLLDDVSEACGVQLEPFPSEDAPTYVAVFGETAAYLELSHDYAPEPDMPFDSYDALITFNNLKRDLTQQESDARRIFAALGAMGRYELMLTFDLQRLLATS